MMTLGFNRRHMLALLAMGGTAALAGCGGGRWQTEYQPAGPSARNWSLAGVDVIVPPELTVSENNSVYVPKADIVWQDEPAGDRRAQVSRILQEGITAGARGLNGPQRVRFRVTLETFHALNIKSRKSAPAGTGVHDIRYLIEVVDAASGTVLVPAQRIAADIEAFTGAEADAADARGETQRVRIVQHLAATTAGWLGLGPDNRKTFSRMGG